MAAKRCVFCKSEKKLTLEHVFPEWLSRLYPDGLAVTNEITGEHGKYWESAIFQHKTRVVCKDCNEGWMSELELKVMPLITELFTLKRKVIDKYQQDDLAFWVQKTMLMINLATPGSLRITPDFYEDLYNNKSSSKKAIVSMGWRMNYLVEKDNPLASFHIIQIPSVEVKKELEEALKNEIGNGGFVWKSTLALGPCVFEVIGHNMKIHLDVGMNTRVFQIIRPFCADLVWPLEWPIEAEGGLHNIINRI